MEGKPYNDWSPPALRRTGRTTRFADQYIQDLFSSETANIKGSIVVRDHHGSPEADKRLADIIMQRLHMEHQHVKATLEVKTYAGIPVYTITIESRKCLINQ